MKMRSLLFVPADSEKKLQKSTSSAADVLIFDLEDAVAQARKPLARDMCAAHLAAHAGKHAWKSFVRINPLGTPEALDDLAAAIIPGVDGILLPKANSVADIVTLSAHIDALEVRAGVPRGHIRILVVATETAPAMLAMGGYRPGLARLVGLTWGAEDLSTAVGALDSREGDGALSHLFLMARSLCLLAARVAEVAPIDTLYADYRDSAGLAADCLASRRRGFTGRIAIHPDQVHTINQSYTPSAADLAAARALVAAFAAHPDQGTVGIDGRMYDRPHLLQAMQTLAMAADDACVPGCID